MPNRKKLISLTGTTCAGKSTLQKALKLASPQEIMIIPQTTTRKPRKGDDLDCFIYTNNIFTENMFLYNKELSYGISKETIYNFLTSNYKIGVVINGTDEIEQLSHSNLFKNEVKTQNILVTFSNNFEKEIQTLQTILPLYFDSNTGEKRLSYFKTHLKEKIFNPDFINTHINLHLTREMDIDQWSNNLIKLLGINENTFKRKLEASISTNTEKRKITTHPYPMSHYFNTNNIRGEMRR